MNYSEILATLGITQGRLETIIIFTVIAIGIGIICVLYWRFLLAGIFALITIFIFSHHETPIESVVKVDTPVITEAVAETQAPPTKAPEVKVDPEYKEFMDECKSLTGKSSMCEELWKDKQ